MFKSIGKNVINVLIFMVLYQLSHYLSPQIPQLGEFIVFLCGVIGGAIVMGINIIFNDNKEGDK